MSVAGVIPRLAGLSVAFSAALTVGSCGDGGGSGTGPDPIDAVATVIVTPSPATVDVGSSIQLNATVLNGLGATVHVAVKWSSSAPSVASIDEDTGLVTGVSEGVAIATASAEGTTGSANVTVNDPAPAVSAAELR
jgi:uncharacterized protein YjdB